LGGVNGGLDDCLVTSCWNFEFCDPSGGTPLGTCKGTKRLGECRAAFAKVSEVPPKRLKLVTSDGRLLTEAHDKMEVLEMLGIQSEQRSASKAWWSHTTSLQLGSELWINHDDDPECWFRWNYEKNKWVYWP
jgi:hypothetical protein